MELTLVARKVTEAGGAEACAEAEAGGAEAGAEVESD